MNVYLITEDGDTGCYVAPSMMAACQLAEDQHIDTLDPDEYADGSEQSERNYYRNEVLQGCSLVGESAATYDVSQFVGEAIADGHKFA